MEAFICDAHSLRQSRFFFFSVQNMRPIGDMHGAGGRKFCSKTAQEGALQML